MSWARYLTAAAALLLGDYTVHVPRSDMAMGLLSPLSAVEAYYKVRELREMDVKAVYLRNAETGEEVDDVASLVRDSPNA